MSSTGKPVCVREYESLAQQVLPRPIFNFIRGGAEEESTVGDNENAFKRYRFLPRMLCGVSKPLLETVVLGQRVSMPIGVAPMGMQKLVDPDGEMATARAVQSMDTIMVVSTVSSCSMEEVAAAAPRAIKWFQLYILDNQEYSRQLVQRAEKSGFQAIVLTADAPRIGKRWDTQRDSFVLPAHVKLPHLTQGADSLGNISDRMVPALTWSTVAWLCSITKLPILVKGILTAEDAVLAARHGAAGVFVSNHGGRQLDSAIASLDALPAIVRAVPSQFEVLLDGGVRSGMDVLKALALGAKAVFVGRPIYYALAYRGEEGVRSVLSTLREETEHCMCLSGCASTEDIDSRLVVHQSQL